ncbi:hypothetical protein VP01_663g12 [Puccinia sorghi]|uniref:Uncharacterized protein n=1 Tax=Puccinia sorghi TaxID=27349 RepID=A0A0L6UH67_9BASI|nr:hypothetical protein VP01_663g12 [Puccinia sorghi]
MILLKKSAAKLMDKKSTNHLKSMKQKKKEKIGYQTLANQKGAMITMADEIIMSMYLSNISELCHPFYEFNKKKILEKK